jgi:hypothetical protein
MVKVKSSFVLGFVALLVVGALFLLATAGDVGSLHVARQSQQTGAQLQGQQIEIVNATHQIYDPDFPLELSDHATEEHPVESVWIRDCLNKNGAVQVFRNRRVPSRFMRVCDLGFDEITGLQFGIQVVERITRDGREVWIEITAYVPKLTADLAAQGIDGIWDWARVANWAGFKP